MSDNKKMQRRRVKLYQQQGGKCFWCHEPMRLLKTSGHPLPVDLCTIDHLRDRFNPARVAKCRGEKRLVAACWQCNFDRGKESQAAQPIEELRRRSGRG